MRDQFQRLAVQLDHTCEDSGPWDGHRYREYEDGSFEHEDDWHTVDKEPCSEFTYREDWLVIRTLHGGQGFGDRQSVVFQSKNVAEAANYLLTLGEPFCTFHMRLKRKHEYGES